MRFLDLTQDFSLHTPAFAGYPGPAIRWIKRLAFEKAGGQEITMTLHVSTHLDAPAHFMTGGKFIGDLPLDFLIGPACVVDLERMASATTRSTAPSTSSGGRRTRGSASNAATSWSSIPAITATIR